MNPILKNISKLASALVVGATLASLPATASATSPFPLTEGFTGTSAAGWTTSGTAVLTANGLDTPGDGWLRLTPATAGGHVGAAYNTTSFPSANGVLVSFDYAAWGYVGAWPRGADGTSVFLFDASQPFSLGVLGGGLGYSGCDDQGAPGLNGGYVGIGLRRVRQLRQLDLLRPRQRRGPQRDAQLGRRSRSDGVQRAVARRRSRAPAGKTLFEATRANKITVTVAVHGPDDQGLRVGYGRRTGWRQVVLNRVPLGVEPQDLEVGFAASSSSSNKAATRSHAVEVGLAIDLAANAAQQQSQDHHDRMVNWSMTVSKLGPRPVSDDAPVALRRHRSGRHRPSTCSDGTSSTCDTGSSTGVGAGTIDLATSGNITSHVSTKVTGNTGSRPTSSFDAAPQPRQRCAQPGRQRRPATAVRFLSGEGGQTSSLAPLVQQHRHDDELRTSLGSRWTTSRRWPRWERGRHGLRRHRGVRTDSGVRRRPAGFSRDWLGASCATTNASEHDIAHDAGHASRHDDRRQARRSGRRSDGATFAFAAEQPARDDPGVPPRRRYVNSVRRRRAGRGCSPNSARTFEGSLGVWRPRQHEPGGLALDHRHDRSGRTTLLRPPRPPAPSTAARADRDRAPARRDPGVRARRQRDHDCASPVVLSDLTRSAATCSSSARSTRPATPPRGGVPLDRVREARPNQSRPRRKPPRSMPASRAARRSRTAAPSASDCMVEGDSVGQLHRCRGLRRRRRHRAASASSTKRRARRHRHDHGPRRRKAVRRRSRFRLETRTGRALISDFGRGCASTSTSRPSWPAARAATRSWARDTASASVRRWCPVSPFGSSRSALRITADQIVHQLTP